MKRSIWLKSVQIVMILSLMLALSPPAEASGAAVDETMVRIGLFYGSSAMPTANLENASGCGSGYRLGYFDSALNFVQLGYTQQTKISMLKTHNIYLTESGTYATTSSGHGTVGCYHVQLPGSYSDFESAKAAADSAGGFAAWISGTYFVRVGSYRTRDQAAEAAAAYSGASVGETTRYGISVTVTGTTNILFQFDDEGSGTGLGVLPDLSGAADVQTWFKGYKYRGGFRYQRIDGGDLTIVNVVRLGDYVKGVTPYEMSPSWPLEALKVQSVCARTYALSNLNKHRSYGFDLCNTTECQVYYGTNRENENTIASVTETAGVTVKYNGAYAQTVFSSSNGGASEAAVNVWGNEVPYLQGVVDPYEADLNIPGYHWTKTLTGAELRDRLIARGYTKCGVIVSVTIQKTAMGNVYSMTFLDENGKSWTVYRERCRTSFGFNSQRFDLAGGEGSEGDPVYVNGQPAGSTSGLYAVDGSGARVPLGESVYVITGTGTQLLEGGPGGTSVSSGTNGVFTFKGTGLGHNVGMSQYGANAMAQRGFGYRDILTFYYTGVTVE